MGPIDSPSPTSTKDALAKIAQNADKLDELNFYLKEAGAFTDSGRNPKNPITSKAMMGSAYKAYPLPEGIEGKTIGDVTKRIATINNENAILRAVAALGMEEAQKPVIPGIPKTPPSPITPGFLTKLNPILNAVQLMMQSDELNRGEDADLAARRKLPPTITK